MSYKIAIASGKGGTGKTTLAVNLFKHLNTFMGGGVQLVDCDVEEPNDLIFFSQAEMIGQKEATQLIPTIDTDKCTFCEKCISYCEFNAISLIPSVTFAQINAALCHSCGACSVACPSGAISEYAKSIGTINQYNTKKVNGLFEGRLKVGSAMQTMLIKALKKSSAESNDILIFDAPPGTSCSVVETVSDANFVILVTEPTPFGLHDLKLLVELIKQIYIPFGVVINKAGLGDHRVHQFLKKEDITLLGEIPFSKAYASAYANGEIFDDIHESISEPYLKIAKMLNRKIDVYEGDHDCKW